MLPPVNWTPLHSHTHYSLVDGLSQPSQVAQRCHELGYASCAITDHGTISGCISFTKAMKEKNIKPILGGEFYLTPDVSIKDKDNLKIEVINNIITKITYEKFINYITFYYNPL